MTHAEIEKLRVYDMILCTQAWERRPYILYMDGDEIPSLTVGKLYKVVKYRNELCVQSDNLRKTIYLPLFLYHSYFQITFDFKYLPIMHKLP